MSARRLPEHTLAAATPLFDGDADCDARSRVSDLQIQDVQERLERLLEVEKRQRTELVSELSEAVYKRLDRLEAVMELEKRKDIDVLELKRNQETQQLLLSELARQNQDLQDLEPKLEDKLHNVLREMSGGQTGATGDLGPVGELYTKLRSDFESFSQQASTRDANFRAEWALQKVQFTSLQKEVEAMHGRRSSEPAFMEVASDVAQLRKDLVALHEVQVENSKVFNDMRSELNDLRRDFPEQPRSSTGQDVAPGVESSVRDLRKELSALQEAQEILPLDIADVRKSLLALQQARHQDAPGTTVEDVTPIVDASVADIRKSLVAMQEEQKEMAARVQEILPVVEESMMGLGKDLAALQAQQQAQALGSGARLEEAREGDPKVREHIAVLELEVRRLQEDHSLKARAIEDLRVATAPLAVVESSVRDLRKELAAIQEAQEVLPLDLADVRKSIAALQEVRQQESGPRMEDIIPMVDAAVMDIRRKLAALQETLPLDISDLRKDLNALQDAPRPQEGGPRIEEILPVVDANVLDVRKKVLSVQETMDATMLDMRKRFASLQEEQQEMGARLQEILVWRRLTGGGSDGGGSNKLSIFSRLSSEGVLNDRASLCSSASFGSTLSRKEQARQAMQDPSPRPGSILPCEEAGLGEVRSELRSLRENAPKVREEVVALAGELRRLRDDTAMRSQAAEDLRAATAAAVQDQLMGLEQEVRRLRDDHSLGSQAVDELRATASSTSTQLRSFREEFSRRSTESLLMAATAAPGGSKQGGSIDVSVSSKMTVIEDEVRRMKEENLSRTQVIEDLRAAAAATARSNEEAQSFQDLVMQSTCDLSRGLEEMSARVTIAEERLKREIEALRNSPADADKTVQLVAPAVSDELVEKHSVELTALRAHIDMMFGQLADLREQTSAVTREDLALLETTSVKREDLDKLQTSTVTREELERLQALLEGSIQKVQGYVDAVDDKVRATGSEAMKGREADAEATQNLESIVASCRQQASGLEGELSKRIEEALANERSTMAVEFAELRQLVEAAVMNQQVTPQSPKAPPAAENLQNASLQALEEMKGDLCVLQMAVRVLEQRGSEGASAPAAAAAAPPAPPANSEAPPPAGSAELQALSQRLDHADGEVRRMMGTMVILSSRVDTCESEVWRSLRDIPALSSRVDMVETDMKRLARDSGTLSADIGVLRLMVESPKKEGSEQSSPNLQGGANNWQRTEANSNPTPMPQAQHSHRQLLPDTRRSTGSESARGVEILEAQAAQLQSEAHRSGSAMEEPCKRMSSDGRSSEGRGFLLTKGASKAVNNAGAEIVVTPGAEIVVAPGRPSLDATQSLVTANVPQAEAALSQGLLPQQEDSVAAVPVSPQVLMRRMRQQLESPNNSSFVSPLSHPSIGPSSPEGPQPVLSSDLKASINKLVQRASTATSVGSQQSTSTQLQIALQSLREKNVGLREVNAGLVEELLTENSPKAATVLSATSSLSAQAPAAPKGASGQVPAAKAMLSPHQAPGVAGQPSPAVAAALAVAAAAKSLPRMTAGGRLEESLRMMHWGGAVPTAVPVEARSDDGRSRVSTSSKSGSARAKMGAMMPAAQLRGRLDPQKGAQCHH